MFKTSRKPLSYQHPLPHLSLILVPTTKKCPSSTLSPGSVQIRGIIKSFQTSPIRTSQGKEQSMRVTVVRLWWKRTMLRPPCLSHWTIKLRLFCRWAIAKVSWYPSTLRLVTIAPLSAISPYPTARRKTSSSISQSRTLLTGTARAASHALRLKGYRRGRWAICWEPRIQKSSTRKKFSDRGSRNSSSLQDHRRLDLISSVGPVMAKTSSRSWRVWKVGVLSPLAEVDPKRTASFQSQGRTLSKASSCQMTSSRIRAQVAKTHQWMALRSEAKSRRSTPAGGSYRTN